MEYLERLVTMGLLGWVVVSALFILGGMVLSMWFVARNLRGVLAIHFGALLGASLAPFLYVLAFWFSNASVTKYPLALFLLLWVGVLLFSGMGLWKLFLGKPKDWVTEGIVFSSYPDFKRWRKNLFAFLALPIGIVAFTTWRLAGPFLVSPMKPFLALAHNVQLLIQGIFALALLAILGGLLWLLFE